MHQIVYAEEMLQTRAIEGMEEQKEEHEKT